jgi:hypothetical protein
MTQIQINTQNSRLTLTIPRPPSLLGKALAVFSQKEPAGDVFVFDRNDDSLQRSGKALCALSQFQSARIDKWLGMAPGGDPSGIRYGLSLLLVDGRKITLVESFQGESLEEMNRLADAVSRYTSVSVHREE